jgi:predicted nucleotidyltransferase
MDKNEALTIAKKYSDLLIESFHPSKVYLYGSFANGNWTSESDIDIAIVVRSLQYDYLKSLNLLYKLRREIDCNIEPVLFIESRDPSGFLESILKNGELLYSKN